MPGFQRKRNGGPGVSFSATRMQCGLLIGFLKITILVLIMSHNSNAGYADDGTEFECQHNYTSTSFINGKIVKAMMVHQQLDPTIMIVTVDANGRQLATLYDLGGPNQTEYLPWKAAQPALPAAEIVTFKDTTRQGNFYLFLALNSVNGQPVKYTNFSPLKPTSTDSKLTSPTGKPSVGLMMQMLQFSDASSNSSVICVAKQFVYADRLGEVLTFTISASFYDANESNRNCALWSLNNGDKFEGFITCFYPVGDPEDDGAMHYLQSIEFNQFPLLSSIRLEKAHSTVLIFADSALETLNASALNDEPKGYAHAPPRNLIYIWTHERGGKKFVPGQVLHVDEVLSMDSVVTAGDTGLLAVAFKNVNKYKSVMGLTKTTVLLYRYSTEHGLFVQHQEIIFVKSSVIQILFQKLLPTQEIQLYVLTNDEGDNVLVYTLQADNTLVRDCKLTSSGSRRLDVASFLSAHGHQNQLMSIVPAGLNVWDISTRSTATY